MGTSNLINITKRLDILIDNEYRMLFPGNYFPAKPKKAKIAVEYSLTHILQSSQTAHIKVFIDGEYYREFFSNDYAKLILDRKMPDTGTFEIKASQIYPLNVSRVLNLNELFNVDEYFTQQYNFSVFKLWSFWIIMLAAAGISIGPILTYLRNLYFS